MVFKRPKTTTQTKTLVPTLAIATALLAGCGGHDSKKNNSSATAPVTSAPVNSNNNNNTGGGTLDVASVQTLATARIAADAVVLALELSAGGADPVELTSLTISAKGSLDESTGLGELKLVGDDNQNGLVDAGEPVLATVAAPAFSQDDGSVSVSLNQAIQIAPSAKLRLLVAVDASAVGAAAVAKIGKTVELEIAAAGDLAVTSLAQPITPGGSFPVSGGPVTLFLHDHLLISEVVTLPVAGEYVEVFNPTGAAIDLSNYYLTDLSVQGAPTSPYHLVPTGAGFTVPTNITTDFLVRFPQGATIAPGQAKVVAVDATAFQTTYQVVPDFCLRNPIQGSALMLNFAAGNWTAAPAQTGAGLTDNGELVYVFHWDGQSDLVQDVDYVFWGTSSAANAHIEKTGLTVDGPDADTTPSAFLTDSPAFQQDSRNATRPVFPNGALQRIEFTEMGEGLTSGNGITGNDETSEPWNTNFAVGVPTPGAP